MATRRARDFRQGVCSTKLRSRSRKTASANSAWLPIDVRAWAEGQPDAGGNEKVARVDRNADLAQWQLVNVPDTATLPYICECEPF